MRTCVLSFAHHARAAQMRQRRAGPNPSTDGAAVSRHQVPEGWTIQAYRFALDPSPTQARAMASNARGGALRLQLGTRPRRVTPSRAQAPGRAGPGGGTVEAGGGCP